MSVSKITDKDLMVIFHKSFAIVKSYDNKVLFKAETNGDLYIVTKEPVKGLHKRVNYEGNPTSQGDIKS